jgi:hypothetical protein
MTNVAVLTICRNSRALQATALTNRNEIYCLWCVKSWALTLFEPVSNKSRNMKSKASVARLSNPEGKHLNSLEGDLQTIRLISPGNASSLPAFKKGKELRVN